MHSRLSRVLLSCRCLYGPWRQRKAGPLRERFCIGALYASPHPLNATTHSHRSSDEETRTQTIGAATELGSKQDDEQHA